MEVTLTPEQEEFIQHAVESGRFQNPEAVLNEVLDQWVEGERRRLELITSIEEAGADIEAGNVSVYTDETLHRLAEEIKREARSERAVRRP